MNIQEYRRMEEGMIGDRPDLSGGYPARTYRTEVLFTSAGSTRVMIYQPHTVSAERLPVFINLHGGGFCLGFPEVDDRYCRRIADEAGCIVVNVDYVLAPECPFPAAVFECHEVAQKLAEGALALPIDTEKIAIGGHSAGGNLAAAVCLLAGKQGGPSFALQVIDYAVLDLATPPREKGKGAKQSDDLLELGESYNSWYLRSAGDARDPLASPLLAEDLTGLPPALVITAELDPLCDEGERYARRLKEAGVDVVSKTYTGCGHGFTHIGPADAADDAWRLMSARLSVAFHAPGAAGASGKC
jgi:acetyl esterase